MTRAELKELSDSEFLKKYNKYYINWLKDKSFDNSWNYTLLKLEAMDRNIVELMHSEEIKIDKMMIFL